MQAKLHSAGSSSVTGITQRKERLYVCYCVDFYDGLDDHARCGWRDKTRLSASKGGICAFAPAFAAIGGQTALPRQRGLRTATLRAMTRANQQMERAPTRADRRPPNSEGAAQGHALSFRR
jgi:hypothetical protein